MGCATMTLKTCLGLVSVFFWACAITLIVIGGLVLSAYDKVADLAEAADIVTPASIIIAVGVFLLIVGVIGCVGGMKSNKIALTLFFIITLLILIGEVVAVGFGYQYREEARTKLTDKLHGMIKDCANGTSSEYCEELDFLQHNMNCCGADTYADWYNYSSRSVLHPIPKSCCRESNCTTPIRTTKHADANKIIFTDGCANKAVNEVEKYYSWIFVATVSVVVLQVLGLVATCIMLFRSSERPYLVLDSQGYRA
ncbi:tetraspanin-3-like [Watersipora subatra]|uniref:tetraspanin-3-like n=1 Tax=Watersipora subatra TaxID=2589382 RepID=UPI00355BD7C8